ncbi:MAG: DnaB-like helicase N-terminal domain-containing protein, partial [Pseudomonadota bacterium]
MNKPLDHDALQTVRIAPHNVEIEQQILGTILANNEAFYRVSDFLKAEHFFVEAHRQIYEIITSLIRGGKVATPLTVKTFLPADATLAELPATEYLIRIAQSTPTPLTAVEYGKQLVDLAVRRSLIELGEDVVNEAYDVTLESTPRQQIEETEKRLYSLAETGRLDQGFI